jgi:hypothetical protein
MEFYLDPDLWVAPEEGACPLDSPQKGDNVSPMTMTRACRQDPKEEVSMWLFPRRGELKPLRRRWERRARRELDRLGEHDTPLPRRGLTERD